MKFLFLLMFFIWTSNSYAFNATLIEGDIVKIRINKQVPIAPGKDFARLCRVGSSPNIEYMSNAYFDEERYSRILDITNKTTEFMVYTVTSNFNNKHALYSVWLINVNEKSALKSLQFYINHSTSSNNISPLTQNELKNYINYFASNNDCPVLINGFDPSYEEDVIVN